MRRILSWFRVGFRVQGFGICVSSSGFWAFALRVGSPHEEDLKRVSGFGFRVSGARLRVQGFQFRVEDLQTSSGEA